MNSERSEWFHIIKHNKGQYIIKNDFGISLPMTFNNREKAMLALDMASERILNRFSGERRGCFYFPKYMKKYFIKFSWEKINEGQEGTT